jgi:hypothetical protein
MWGRLSSRPIVDGELGRLRAGPTFSVLAMNRAQMVKLGLL